MEEMQKLIGQRQGEGTPLSRPRPFSAFDTPTRAPSFDGTDAFKPLIQSIAEADDSLMQGINGYNNIQGSLEELSTAFREVRRLSSLSSSYSPCHSNLRISTSTRLKYKIPNVNAK